jgi:hypothetical protein
LLATIYIEHTMKAILTIILISLAIFGIKGEEGHSHDDDEVLVLRAFSDEDCSDANLLFQTDRTSCHSPSKDFELYIKIEEEEDSHDKRHEDDDHGHVHFVVSYYLNQTGCGGDGIEEEYEEGECTPCEDCIVEGETHYIMITHEDSDDDDNNSFAVVYSISTIVASLIVVFGANA